MYISFRHVVIMHLDNVQSTMFVVFLNIYINNIDTKSNPLSFFGGSLEYKI